MLCLSGCAQVIKQKKKKKAKLSKQLHAQNTLDTTKSTLQLLIFCLREMLKIFYNKVCMQNKLW